MAKSRNWQKVRDDKLTRYDPRDNPLIDPDREVSRYKLDFRHQFKYRPGTTTLRKLWDEPLVSPYPSKLKG